MAYTKTEWKDRIVEYPNRYTDQNGVIYTLTPAPGSITEEGTTVTAVNLNKLEEGVRQGVLASGTGLEQATIDLFGVDNVDLALRKSLNLSSYMAFCSNVNTDSLDAGFGKNNEDRVMGLGLQLAMYSWFKGTNKTIKPYTELINSVNTINDLFVTANQSMFQNIFMNDDILFSLLMASPYAKQKVIDNQSKIVLPDKILYNLGDECSSVSGGWNKTSTGANFIRGYTNSTGTPTGTVSTKNNIPLRGYRFAKVQYTFNATYYPSGGITIKGNTVGVSQSSTELRVANIFNQTLSLGDAPVTAFGKCSNTSSGGFGEVILYKLILSSDNII